MIEREEKDGVWDEKKNAFGVFIFYAKKKKIKIWKNDKRSSKKKVWVKKIFEERQAKGTFNLGEYKNESHNIHCKTSLQYSHIEEQWWILNCTNSNNLMIASFD